MNNFEGVAGPIHVVSRGSPSADASVWHGLNAAAVALFLDVDGTLLDFADRPDLVDVPKELVMDLARVERRLGGALALVSGRQIEELDRLFMPLRLRASGVHGAQMRFIPDGDIRDVASASGLPDALWTQLIDALVEFPDVLVENKGFSFAVHYRRCPDVAAPLRAALRRLMRAQAWRAVGILDAHYAFELKPPNFDKGKAIALFMNGEPFRDRTPIFVGDDTTDEPGFALVSARGGLAFCVGAHRVGATGAFGAPRDVRDWLTRLAAQGGRQ